MKKKLFLLIFLFLVTGCSATYDIEIYNNTVKEDLEYIDSIPSNWDKEAQYGLTYRELVVDSSNYPYPVFDSTVVDENDTIKIEGVEYYDNTLISDSNRLGQKLSYHQFTLDNFYDSSIVKKCYQYFSVLEEDNHIILSTSLENTCFDSYPSLDFITVNLKTNHKVVSNNADIVDGYHYTWNISRTEKDDAAILITLEKNEYIFNYENEFAKKVIYIAIIVGIILVVSSLIYIYFKNKRKRLNEI